RIEQLLLLAVRMGLVALIVFAMAAVSPWAESLWASIIPPGWVGSTISTSQRMHHVLVLDASLSMNLRDAGSDKTIFERARKLALDKIESCQSGDAFSVLLLKDNPTWLVAEISQDKRKVLTELEAVR